MSPVFGGIQLFAAAATAFACVGALVGGFAVRRLGDPLAAWEPRSRHRALVLLAALPAIVTLVLLLSVALPSLQSLVTPSLDHCSTHDDGHAHLCFVHLPKAGLHTFALLALVFVGSYFAVRTALAAAAITRAMRALRVLLQTGEHLPDLGVTVLETPEPICLTAGMIRPRIMLSRGLLETLRDDERAVVLAHEHAHARRRDALIATLARALATLHLPSLRSRVIRDLELAAEQACDEEAARVVGSRTTVASAILTVERAVQSRVGVSVSRIAVAFGRCGVDRRVESLLADPTPPRSSTMLLALVFLGTAVALRMANELHHLTESLLSVFAN